MRVGEKIQSFWSIMWPTEISARPEYRAAKEFAQTIEPTRNKDDYEWVWSYSESEYDRISKIYTVLDEKSNDIIKYLGGGTGIFTIGLISNINHKNVGIFMFSAPFYVFALVSILLAVLVRKPNPGYSPPSIEDAFNYANDYDEKIAKANFIGQWHLACEAMRQSIVNKSRRLEAATWMFFFAIGLLLLPVTYAVWKAWTAC